MLVESSVYDGALRSTPGCRNVSKSLLAKANPASSRSLPVSGAFHDACDRYDGIDFEAVADTQPDVILAAYSGLTQEDYDTLSKIAKQYYGDANKYPRIFEANREVIKDANLIYPGQKIRIPRAA